MKQCDVNTRNRHLQAILTVSEAVFNFETERKEPKFLAVSWVPLAPFLPFFLDTEMMSWGGSSKQNTTGFEDVKVPLSSLW